MKTSVIVATLNCAATLDRCLDSITIQRGDDVEVELVVIDGGSRDGTVEIITGHAGVAKTISEPDRGIYDAWNKGLAQSSGDWICFLGADDYFWSDTVLATLLPSLSSESNAPRVVYGTINRVDVNGTIIDTVGEPWPALERRWRRGMVLPHPGLLHRRDLFRDHGNFDISFCIAGDYELLLRELPSRSARFVPDVIVAGVQDGGISTTASYARRSLHEARRARKTHGLAGSALSEWGIITKHHAASAVQRVAGLRAARRIRRIWRRRSTQKRS